MLGRVERGGHVLLAACRGSSEAAGFPARSEMLQGWVGGDIHVDVGVAGDDHRVPPAEAACRGIYLYVGPETRPSRRRGAACLRPVDVDEGEASPVRLYRRLAGAIPLVVRDTPHGCPPELPPKGGGMWPYPWTHVGTPSHLGHLDRVAATLPSQAPAGAA